MNLNLTYIRQIFFLSLKIDFIGKRGEKRFKKFISLFLSYLITGFFISESLYLKCDLYTFLFILFSFTIVFVGMNILSNIDIIFGTEKEIYFYSYLPFDIGNFFLAKVFSSIVFFIVSSLFLNLFAFLFLYLKTSDILLLVNYIIFNSFLVVFVVFSILIIYFIFLKNLSKLKIKNALSNAQVILIFIIILGYQFVTNILKNDRIFYNFSSSWLNLLPPSWLSNIVLYQKGLDLIWELTALLLNILVLLIITSLLVYYSVKILSANYSNLINIKAEIVKSKENGIIAKWLNIIKKALIPNIKEYAAFELFSDLYKKEKSLKLRILPGMIFPFSILIFGLINDTLYNPFTYGITSSASVSHMTLLYLIIFLAFFTNNSIKISSMYEASWIFSTFNVPVGILKSGFHKFIFYKIILPFFLLIFIVFVLKMAITAALLQTIFLYLCYKTVKLVLMKIDKNIPLSKKPDKTESLSLVFKVIYLLPISILFMLIHIFLFKRIFLFANTMLLIYLTGFILERRLRSRTK
jgi:hypothetical protein